MNGIQFALFKYHEFSIEGMNLFLGKIEYRGKIFLLTLKYKYLSDYHYVL